MRTTRIRTFYPADPAGVVPGGVDTFIRGLIKWAPDDIEFSLVGMTTDEPGRPVGRWTRCDLGRREFDFFPVVKVDEAGGRSRIPLSLRFSLGARRYRRSCSRDFDIYEFHRVEPALLYLGDTRPKNAFFHTDMAVIRTERKTDILWRGLPGLYFALESRVFRSLSSAWSVREQAAESLRERYPFLAEHIHYTPTWVDTEVFFPLPDDARRRLRTETEAAFDLDPAAFRVVTVGRLDTSKDPDLLLSAVGKLVAEGANVELLFIGDGVLRDHLAQRAADEGLSGRVRFLGLRSAAEIARYLQAADCFALSSAYEGMPMALLEAQGAGVPVVTTPVGEVRRIVVNGVNGEITPDRSVASFAHGLDQVRRHPERYSVANCTRAVEPFTPSRVLAPVYDNYRALEASSHVRVRS
ncbi:MAG: glycosyltransferase [Betaproteobacteria bacterium]|nr:glycosyltransferase [Betaproteobacteria bacterium]